MNGIIIVDKPGGISSNGVLNRLKAVLGRPKMGFLGTLDPLATGVLPVFVGKATKLIPAFEGTEKAYRATLELGRRTDTLDVDGRELARAETGHLTAEAVEEAILAFQGEIEQRVPDFSAVKHDGVPAYRLARKGDTVPPAVRTVRVWDTAVECIDLPLATFRTTCSAGTYIRSLVADVGERLGVGAVVTALRRLSCGGAFLLENALTLAQIEGMAAQERADFLLDPGELLTDHAPYWVEEQDERRLRHGQIVPLPSDVAGLRPEAKLKALRPGGTLVAIGQVVRRGADGLGFQPTRVLL